LEIILQRGGNMLDTCTKLHFSIPASRKARSKECNSSLCVPTPFVKKIFLGTKLSILPLLLIPAIKNNVFLIQLFAFPAKNDVVIYIRV
jgi:hypothetical protein